MAEPEPLPKEVRDLVRRRVRTMEEIEVLLLLASSPRAMSVTEMCGALKIARSTLPVGCIERLCEGGLAELEPGSDDRYRYAPATPELRKGVALLAISYNERPVSLVRLVYHRDDSSMNFDDDLTTPG